MCTRKRPHNASRLARLERFHESPVNGNRRYPGSPFYLFFSNDGVYFNPMKNKKPPAKKTPRPPSAALLKKIDALEKKVSRLSSMLDKKNIEENALEKERTLLRTLIDTMPDYIYVKDAESRFVVNNKAHLEVLGAKSQAEVAGKTDLDIFPADLAARYFSDEQIVLQLGRPVVNREEPVVSRNKIEKWLSTTKVAVRDPDGRISGLVGISRDITERKTFEKALQKAKDELEMRVAERTIDLKNANLLLAEGLSQLHFLNRASFKLSQLLEVKELGPEIVQAFVARFPQAEAALFVKNVDKFEVLGSTKLFSGPQAEYIALSALDLLDHQNLQKAEIVKDWTQDKKYAPLNWSSVQHLPCYLTVPLLADKKCIAIVQIFTTAAFCAAFEAELPVINTLAAHAASCLSNALNYQELDKNARQQGELSAARIIQQRFSLFSMPTVPRLRFKSIYLPAYEVGGDYLDCFETDKGDWVIVIADVCGKGMPAALFMIMLRTSFRMLGHAASSARELMCAVNAEMRANLTEMIFVTAMCLVIKKDGSSMTCVRAGHPGLLWQKRRGEEPEFLKTKGLAMGLVSNPDAFANILEESFIPLEKSNRFLIYTDGLTEALDPAMNLYGLDRLNALLASDTSQTPDGLVESILGDIRVFQKDRRQATI